MNAYDMITYNVVCYDIIQYGMIQYGIIQYNTIQYNPPQVWFRAFSMIDNPSTNLMATPNLGPAAGDQSSPKPGQAVLV